MKKLALTVAILCFSAGSVLADKAAAPAATNSDEQIVALLEELASIVDKDKANCDQMGTDLGKFVDDNHAKMEKLKEEGKKRTDEEKKAAREKYKDRFMAAMQKMKDGMTACHDNAKVKAAMEKMRPSK